MKIELVPMFLEEGVRPSEPEFFALNISGALDPDHETLKRARELAEKSGNQDVIRAFDRSVQGGLLFALALD